MYPHATDGAFTDWDPEEPLALGTEWSDVQPLEGQFTWLYVDYDGEKIHILNDWHYNDATPPDPACYNEFDFSSNGTDLNIKVYGDQTIVVMLDGAPADIESEGGSGFGRSPMVPDRDHTLWELAITVPPGPWSCRLHDPGPDPQSSCEDLATEEHVLEGEAVAGGGLVVRASSGPVLLGAAGSGASADPGDWIAVRIANLADGGAGAIAWFGWRDADIVAEGGADEYIVQVPWMEPGVVDLRIEAADGRFSMAVPFEVLADPGAVDADGDGWSVNDGDCMDDNPDVRPYQEAFFSVHRGDGSFDYDCDGWETLLWTDLGSCGLSPSCTGAAGWCQRDCACPTCVPDGTVPGCGESAMFVDGLCTEVGDGSCNLLNPMVPQAQSCH